MEKQSHKCLSLQRQGVSTVPRAKILIQFHPNNDSVYGVHVTKCNTVTTKRGHVHSAPFRKRRNKLVFLDKDSKLVQEIDNSEMRPKSTVPKLTGTTRKKTQRHENDADNGKIQYTLNRSKSELVSLKTLSSTSDLTREGRSSSETIKDPHTDIVKGRLKDMVKERRQHFHTDDIMEIMNRRKESGISRDLSLDREDGPGYVKFRKVVTCIRIVIRLLAIIIDISDTKTVRTATEEQWYTLHNSKEALTLAFNKALFVRQKTFAKVPDWAVRIFDDDPSERTDNDCRRIHALLRGLKSFDKFTEKIQLYMCRSFRYMRVDSGRVILRRGHVGFNFYFIYSGSVFVNLEDVNIEGKRFEKTETVLVRGDSFGELALLQDIRRTASITCREKCELLVVDKETFAKVCPSIFERELEEKKQFLSGLPLFVAKLWTNEKLKTLSSEAQIQEYKTNKVVATDNDEEEWMYICMEGKCQIIRRLALDKTFDERQNSKRLSTPQLSEEILDIIKTVNKIKEAPEDKDDEDDENKDDTQEEEEEADEQSKERLLVSMLLEYRKDGKRRKNVKITAKEEEENIKAEKMSLKGPTTLTSLMAQDKKIHAKTDFVYLNIATLLPHKIFDLYSIIYPDRRSPNSTVILVSCGARLLRIKKKIFFSLTTPDSILHSKSIANKERYPRDGKILESYVEKSNWENYKYAVFQDVMEPLWQARSQRTNIQMKDIHDRQYKTYKLLQTLRSNAKKEKTYETKSDAEENEILKNFENNMEALFLLHRNIKVPEIVEIQHNFVVGRRSSCSSIAYRRASQRANSIIKGTGPLIEQSGEADDAS